MHWTSAFKYDFHWEQSHLTRHCKDVPCTSWNKIISRGAHTHEKSQQGPLQWMEGKVAEASSDKRMQQEQRLPKHFLTPHSWLLRWKPLRNQNQEQTESLSQPQADYTFKCNKTMERQIWPPERDLQQKLAVFQLHNKNTGRNTNYNTTDPWSGKMHWNETSTGKSMSNGGGELVFPQQTGRECSLAKEVWKRIWLQASSMLDEMKGILMGRKEQLK